MRRTYNTMNKTKLPVMVILNDVRSAHNVGSIFRTADAAGVSRIYIAGYTPAPIDRFGRPQGDIEKTALGAELSVPWENYQNVVELIKKLQSEGVYVVAVEQRPGATDYKDLTLEGPTAFVFGNEVDGIPDEACEAADAVVDIVMRGKKESLNVAIAVGVVLFRFLDR